MRVDRGWVTGLGSGKQPGNQCRRRRGPSPPITAVERTEFHAASDAWRSTRNMVRISQNIAQSAGISTAFTKILSVSTLSPTLTSSLSGGFSGLLDSSAPQFLGFSGFSGFLDFSVSRFLGSSDSSGSSGFSLLSATPIIIEAPLLASPPFDAC